VIADIDGLCGGKLFLVGTYRPRGVVEVKYRVYADEVHVCLPVRIEGPDIPPVSYWFFVFVFKIIGINPEKIYTYTFVISAVMGAVSGMLIGVEQNLYPRMGVMIIIKVRGRRIGTPHCLQSRK